MQKRTFLSPYDQQLLKTSTVPFLFLSPVPRHEVDDMDEADDLYEYEEYEELPLSYSMVAVTATIGFILIAGMIALSITLCVKYKDPIR